MLVKKTDVVKLLKKVLDPELGVSLWDLGLIYDVDVSEKGDVKITMTLTSIGCPLYSVIESEIIEKVSSVKGVKKVTVDLTFEPLWNMDKISKTAKKKLGL
jgi:metal-sulfur cluster biosynthetic enzyme